MKKKNIQLAIVILFGIAAAIWTISTVVQMAYGTLEGLTLLAAAVWMVGFLLNLYRYRSGGGK